MEINDVLSKRETLRNKAKETLRKQLQSLGIFLETIEIKDIRIQNGQLFKDMQSKFRENIKRKSDLHKQKTDAMLSKLTEEQTAIYKKEKDDVDQELEKY